jgi:C-terminal, D2-small domain, of ClpB protein
MRTAAIRQQSDPSPRNELDKVLQNELDRLQQRILQTGKGEFFFDVTGSAKEFLLLNGLERRCGAFDLKLAIERHIVFPLADLFATGQVLNGDRVCIDQDQDQLCLIFTHKGKNLAAPGRRVEPNGPLGTVLGRTEKSVEVQGSISRCGNLRTYAETASLLAREMPSFCMRK